MYSIPDSEEVRLDVDLVEPPPGADEDLGEWWHELDASVSSGADDEPWGLDDVVCLSEPEVDGTVRTLADFLSDQASYFNAVGTAAGRWLGAELHALAEQARGLNALTPDVFASRREQADASRAEDLIHAGYVRGLADGRASGDGYDGPLD